MQKITSFFWFCSGADVSLLSKCPTESSRYVGIGATVFFTGLFAAISGGYALYTVFDNVFAAILFGAIWGLMIFNLDRYIVSTMRKEGKRGRELLLALPRIVLAILISIVIARPLELRIFAKEIQAELVVMEQQKFAEQEGMLRQRFTPAIDSMKNEISMLKSELKSKAEKRDELARIAQEEADGTGGSRRRNLGPIYKIKKADADKAEVELQELTLQHNKRIAGLEAAIKDREAAMGAEHRALERTSLTGPAARIEALSRVTAQSDAIYWAHWFILLLFISIETAPVFVKLISPKGPYDNLLKMEEHGFRTQEIEVLARTNTEAKDRASVFAQHERNYVTEKLDAELKQT